MSPRQLRKTKPRPRRRARARAAAGDSVSLRHEAHTYQEELQVQNEELVRAQMALEESRARFIDLYDFAPNAYLILDINGVIRQANLMGASLLGKPRKHIEGIPLVNFVAAPSRAGYFDFLRQCRAAREDPHLQPQPQVSVDVQLQLTSGLRDVQIVCRPTFSSVGNRELLAGIIDISERRHLEDEQKRASREHAALASRLLSAQDEERQRIARDLHDNVGQQVTALRLILQVAQMTAVSDEVRSRLEQAQSIVEHIDGQLDFLTGELRPASLDLGIAAAVEEFVRSWSTTFAISAGCQCVGMDDVSMDRDVETHIYRVMQEALNNVYKHARARRVTVALEHGDGTVILRVEDNGRGFDASPLSPQQGRGLGLLSMKERADLVGGTLKITAAPLHGTSVVLRVPIAGRTESR